MSYWNRAYKGVFMTQERDPVTNLSLDVDCEVWIYDTTSGVADDPTEIIELPMADQPVIVEVVDNDEDKFETVIRSKRATVNIFSSDTIGIETFIDSGDHGFFAEIYTNDGLITGYLSVADVSEDFQPDPNVISLIISDGLGFGEDKELVDFDGNVPSGVHPIGRIIQWALAAGTGYRREMKAIFNIRDAQATNLDDDISGATGVGHFFVFNYLDIRTFEGDNPGTRLKCIDVLKRILKGCELSQQGFFWYIKRIDELQSDPSFLYLANFDQDGSFVLWETITPSNVIKSIGDGLALSWMNDDTVISADRAVRRLELKRDYEYFSEIPCNKDFERGTGADPTGAADETIDYDLECWQYLREGSSPSGLDSAPFAGSVGKLRKRFVYNYEVERYLITQVAGGFRHYFKSEGIYAGLKEKFQIGIQYRFSNDISAATINIMHLRLIGSDGFIYDLSLDTSGDQNWHQKTASDPVFDDTIQIDVPGPTDTTEWQSFSFTTIPVPVSGTLYIRLLNDLASPVGRDFNALTVEAIPLINGTYAKFTGEQHSIEQTGDNVALRQDTISLGTGPDMNVKGAILRRGTDTLLYSGSADFSASNYFQLPGDRRGSLLAGQQIVIAGSGAGNDSTVTITSVSYSLIGSTTTVITDGAFNTEIGATITISLITYELSENFYSAAVLTGGFLDPVNTHPYGHLIAFDIWNQYNRVMRKFEGAIDGLNLDLNPVDLGYIYSMADSNFNTGVRVFMLLHYAQDIHLAAMIHCVFVEIYSTEHYKQYDGHEFKYLTE